MRAAAIASMWEPRCATEPGSEIRRTILDDTTVQGITPSMAPIYDTDLTSGRMLNETDLKTSRRSRSLGPIWWTT